MARFPAPVYMVSTCCSGAVVHAALAPTDHGLVVTGWHACAARGCFNGAEVGRFQSCTVCHTSRHIRVWGTYGFIRVHVLTGESMLQPACLCLLLPNRCSSGTLLSTTRVGHDQLLASSHLCCQSNTLQALHTCCARTGLHILSCTWPSSSETSTAWCQVAQWGLNCMEQQHLVRGSLGYDQVQTCHTDLALCMLLMMCDVRVLVLSCAVIVVCWPLSKP